MPRDVQQHLWDAKGTPLVAMIKNVSIGCHMVVKNNWPPSLNTFHNTVPLVRQTGFKHRSETLRSVLLVTVSFTIISKLPTSQGSARILYWMCKCLDELGETEIMFPHSDELPVLQVSITPQSGQGYKELRNLNSMGLTTNQIPHLVSWCNHSPNPFPHEDLYYQQLATLGPIPLSKL